MIKCKLKNKKELIATAELAYKIIMLMLRIIFILFLGLYPIFMAISWFSPEINSWYALLFATPGILILTNYIFCIDPFIYTILDWVFNDG